MRTFAQQSAHYWNVVRRINVFLLLISMSRGCFHNRDGRSICHRLIAVPHWSFHVERPDEELNASALPIGRRFAFASPHRATTHSPLSD